MDNFANIGKAVILQSIGLQKNYIETKDYTSTVTDYSNSFCSTCKYRAIHESFSKDSLDYITAENVCANCPNRITKEQIVTKKIYHNEKNRYGYKPRLKSNSIKLLFLFHFYHPDRFGIIKDVSMLELATRLNCNIKTIKNNLAILSNYNYISYEINHNYNITLCINDYENYYLPANKGGRGFIVVSQDLLRNIIAIDNLISLRIHLREIIELDTLNQKSQFTAISTTCSDLRLSLPEYCKPCIIKSSINKNNQPELSSNRIFKISVKDNVIRFEINDIYNSKNQKAQCLNQYIDCFNDFMSDFNNSVILANTSDFINSSYHNFFDQTNNEDRFHIIKFTEIELMDLAQLSLQYSYALVIEAFSIVYKTYIQKDHVISNLGGLIRTIIRTNLNNKFSAA